MKFVFSVSLALAIHFTHAQQAPQQFLTYPKFEFYSRIGTVMMMKKPENINLQLGTTSGFTAGYNFRIGRKANFLHTGASFTGYRYITDGYFDNQAGKNAFLQTPFDFKQNEFSLHYIQFPIQYKFVPLNGIGFGIGPYVGYFFEGTQQYKINNDKFHRDVRLEQKFQAGLEIDAHLQIPPGKWLLSPLFGLGAAYQFTDHIRDRPSFRPVSIYFTVGMGLW